MNKEQNLEILRTQNVRPTTAATALQCRRNFRYCRPSVNNGGNQSTRSQVINHSFNHRDATLHYLTMAVTNCPLYGEHNCVNGGPAALPSALRDKVNTTQQQEA
jgi:hypothetical protein